MIFWGFVLGVFVFRRGSFCEFFTPLAKSVNFLSAFFKNSVNFCQKFTKSRQKNSHSTKLNAPKPNPTPKIHNKNSRYFSIFRAFFSLSLNDFAANDF